MASSSRQDPAGVLRAAEALRRVGETARVFFSAPAIEGITPAALLDPARSEAASTDEALPRRHGVFRLNEIGLGCMDHGVLYGDGCFEGILITDGRIFLLKEHMIRLAASARKLAIDLPYACEDLVDWMLRTARQVDFEAGGRGYIRLLVTRGFGDLGINPAKCVGATIFSLTSTIRLYPREMYETGIELGLARQVRRPHASVLDPTVKSNNYVNNVMALMEGTRAGSQLEALILTRDGFIAEATVDNLFFVRRLPGWEHHPERVVVATPSRDYCLNGITRALVLETCRQMGYSVDEAADLVPIDLIGPDRECFMTGTGAGVMPIVKVVGNLVGDGTPGPITRELVRRVEDAMVDPAYGLPINATTDEVRAYLDAPAMLESEMRLYDEHTSRRAEFA